MKREYNCAFHRASLRIQVEQCSRSADPEIVFIGGGDFTLNEIAGL
jgi:hypothetical protein